MFCFKLAIISGFVAEHEGKSILFTCVLGFIITTNVATCSSGSVGILKEAVPTSTSNVLVGKLFHVVCFIKKV